MSVTVAIYIYICVSLHQRCFWPDIRNLTSSDSRAWIWNYRYGSVSKCKLYVGILWYCTYYQSHHYYFFFNLINACDILLYRWSQDERLVTRLPKKLAKFKCIFIFTCNLHPLICPNVHSLSLLAKNCIFWWMSAFFSVWFRLPNVRLILILFARIWQTEIKQPRQHSCVAL